jgi:beta-galactosidase
VATDVLRTAGDPHRLKLTPDRRVIDTDGESLSFVTVEVVDEHDVVVPSADDLVSFTVRGGSLAGVDNGRQESAENYRADERSAFNGRALAIVRSDEDPGPIVVTARADGVLPATTTIFDAAPGRDRARIVGAVDPYVRTPVGVAPSLPERVTVVRGDGSTSDEPVVWSQITPIKIGSDRTYEVPGAVRGSPGSSGNPVTAHVTPYRVSDVERFATRVPVGVPPFLPGEATVTYTDEVTEFVGVTWDPVPPQALATPGVFTVRGELAGAGLTTSSVVTVSDAYTPGQNLARQASSSASFSGSPQTVPASLTNGATSETSGWSNRYTKAATALLPSYSLARGEDWVSLAWTSPQAVNTLVPYFRLATGRTFPASVSVEYWDGRRFVPAANQAVTMATVSEQPTTITFDPVSTTIIRLVMASSAPGTSNGFVQISELEALGSLPSS